MAEYFPTTTDLNNKNGGDVNLIDPVTGMPWWRYLEDPHYASVTRMIWHLMRQTIPAFEIYKSDSAVRTINMRGGYIVRGVTIDTVAAVADTALANNDTSYVYLLYSGAGAWTLTVATDAVGWPTKSTPAWLPLAIVKCGTDSVSGAIADDFDPDPAKGDLIDLRWSWLFSPGAAAAGAGTIDVTLGTSASPRVLTDAHSGMTHANSAATAMDYQALPAAAAGLEFEFIIADADGLRATAAAGDTIRVSDQVSIAAGYIESTQIGAVVRLKAIDATQWIAVNVIGAWPVQTS